MGDTKDRVGAAGVIVAGGFFKIALYVCVAVLVIWIGKVTYQFGYNVFNQQAMNPGEGQEVTVVIKEDATSYDIAKTLKSKGLIEDTLVFWVQEKLSNSLDTGNTPFLDELECSALSEGVPIIRKEMQSFIKTLLALKKPQRILEVGTAVGFSTLLMCEYGQPDMHITTIENYEKRIPIARENFRKAGKEHRITFLTGDAGEILPTLLGRYDLIFMDAAKGQYIHWLPDVVTARSTKGCGNISMN